MESGSPETERHDREAPEPGAAGPAAAPADGTADETGSEGHEDPNYMAVWAGLAALTLLEVWVATLGMSQRTAILVLVGLAIWKALLVALYYMHLRFEPRRLIFVALSPLPLAVILVMAVLMEF